MRARSWMAALALIAGTSIAVGRAMPASSPTEDQGQEQPQPPQDDQPAARLQTTDAKPADKPIKAVVLNLEIAGLSPEGCDVEVKPGNASCRFQAINMTKNGGKLERAKEGAQHVSSVGHAVLELQNVELRGADRTCTVAITVRESGQAPKTVYRGFRLPARPEAGLPASVNQVPTFTCYLSSPSKVANVEQSRTRK
jgi:hypothetical protein